MRTRSAGRGRALVFEDVGTGEDFPHIYGPIDPAWVVEVRDAGFDEDGRFAGR